MKFKTVVKLNANVSIEAEFDAKDLQEAIHQAGALLELDGQCGECPSKFLTLRTRNVRDAKGNPVSYTELYCKECGAHRTFGAYRTGGFFLKPWQKKFEGNKGEE